MQSGIVEQHLLSRCEVLPHNVLVMEDLRLRFEDTGALICVITQLFQLA